MSGRTIAAVLTVGFFTALVQLVGGLFSHPVALLCGPLIAMICIIVVRFFEIELEQVGVVLLPTLSSAAGVACLAFVPGAQAPILWVAPLLACAVASLVLWFRQASSSRCALCGRRLGRAVSFGCPRCGLEVCDACWVFEYQRCRLCEQNRVPIFTDSRWWDRELGPKLTFGRCHLCLTEAASPGSDLRACRNCGRPQCRSCWDASNGECRRCGWIVQNLPPALRPYMARSHADGGGRRAARSGT